QSPGRLRDAPPLFRIDHEWKGPALNVIMGESGAGKSTLLKTLGGVWKPLSGKIFFEDQPLWAENGFNQNQTLLDRIGFCFQNNALFNSMSCFENLAFPRSKRRPNESAATRRMIALMWLDKVGLGGSDDLMPHELSGGMQKRLAIARTLILEPDYIFFDDPTAGLDPITSRQIALLLLDLLQKRPALSFVVTNDEDRARSWSKKVFELRQNSLQEKVLE
ncbi:MAG: ATP-binding cassette domain-containing protein, partial [Bdellovibrionota bacterium]